MKKSDMMIGIYILAAIVFLIIPIPTQLLDVLMALNIAVSLIIMFNALFSKEALDMSTFPSILLFTTVFRISLNVSSTRNILTKGYAGGVVAAFGEFVGGGDMIVGAIVFIILLLVQFMVINKGSERVSEVSARFTLDAMPGKQMAIDADLNTGAITDAEAKERRQKIQDEASFFGAMDGATKYVKGDATAGLLITLVNIIGGVLMGITRQGLDAMTALNQYGLLTIGDGLVSQIPSLLTSLSTGIIVTKVSKEADIGDVLVKQLFSLPKVLYMVGAAMAFLGIFTGLPTMVFVLYGVLFLAVARAIQSKMEVAAVESEVSEVETSAEEIRKPENVVSLLQVDAIELEFGYGIIPLADVNQGGDLLDRVVLIRRQIALEYGCVVPTIRMRDNIQLNPNQYIIKIKGIQVSEGEILFDHYMAMNPGMWKKKLPVFLPMNLPSICRPFGLPKARENVPNPSVIPLLIRRPLLRPTLQRLLNSIWTSSLQDRMYRIWSTISRKRTAHWLPSLFQSFLVLVRYKRYCRICSGKVFLSETWLQFLKPWQTMRQLPVIPTCLPSM